MLPDRYTTCMLIIPQSLSALVYVLDCGIVLFIPYFSEKATLSRLYCQPPLWTYQDYGWTENQYGVNIEVFSEIFSFQII